MPFEFHLRSLEEMRATPDAIGMLTMIDDDNFRSALISGCPGSGKTTVSIYRLVRLNSQQASVHLVTFQNLLVLSIQSLANKQTFPPGSVSTFHKWYCPLTKSRFDTDSPPTDEEMNKFLQRSRLAEQQLEEILIDEGQDLPLCVYRTIPKYAKRCFVGADNAQQVHPRHGAKMEQIEDSLRQSHAPYKRFDLGRNFRNTYETYRFARQFVPRTNRAAWNETILERLQHSNRRGPKPTVITYRDPNARNTHLRTTLANAEGNVAILCPLGPCPRGKSHSGESVDEVYEIVQGMGIAATKYHAKLPVPSYLERYIVTTFKSVQGMEFDTVVIPRIDFFKTVAEEWYVACTRARGRLFLYRDVGAPQCDPVSGFERDTYEGRSLEAASAATPAAAAMDNDDDDLPF
ncbi:MAG: hypothetical protein V1800_15255 [Candidatus Latescibacterota bacterium]